MAHASANTILGKDGFFRKNLGRKMHRVFTSICNFTMERL